MTIMEKPLTGALLDTEDWTAIDWQKARQNVKRLQMRIAKAVKDQKWGKVKSLQWLLTHSRSAKLLAVRKVTSNRGGKTAGIDSVTWLTSNQKLRGTDSLKRRGYKPLPLRRIYIPKKNGEKRPLGIPCIRDRAFQALHLFALEPVSETIADLNSYGFRPHRSTADAVAQCFNVLCRTSSAGWVLEGDIKSCFEEIDHQWLMESIPMDTQILGKWLRCGFLDKGVLFHTNAGTPQGGVISPTLMLMTLQGLERCIKATAKTNDKVHVVIYADDFVVTAASKEVLVDKVLPAINVFLGERGLRLSQEKTSITNINTGFDFLGFNVRKYDGKLLIKPAKSNILKFLRSLSEHFKTLRAESASTVIRVLNPKLRGWTNYYRHVVSSQTFSTVAHRIFWMTWRWARRRHPNKSASWVRRKYFCNVGGNQWVFFGLIGDQQNSNSASHLFSPTNVPITRHVKIKSAANPHDPAYIGYFVNRRQRCSFLSPTVVSSVLS